MSSEKLRLVVTDTAGLREEYNYSVWLVELVLKLALRRTTPRRRKRP
jgi:hypothetical protein